MKVLFIKGDDYAALSFEQEFKGHKVSDIIANIDNYEKDFLLARPEYEDTFNIRVEELNVDAQALESIIKHIGDYDYLKSENLYGEHVVLKG